jgi:WD40 repeat protein
MRKEQAPRPVPIDVSGAQAMAFSPDGKLLAIGYRGCLVVKDVATRKEEFKVDPEWGVDSVVFSPDGRLLASAASLEAITHASADAGIRLRDSSTGQLVAKLEGHTEWVCSLAFAPDGKKLASSSLDGTVRIWDVAKREAIRVIIYPAHKIAFSPDGKKLAIACKNDTRIRLLNPASGEVLLEIQDVQYPYRSLSFSRDGKTLAVAGGASAIRLWDTETGKTALPADGHDDAVVNVVFSPDGRTIASRGGDKTVRLWNLETHKQKSILRFGSDAFLGRDPFFLERTCCLAFTADGNKVAAAGAGWWSADPPSAFLLGRELRQVNDPVRGAVTPALGAGYWPRWRNAGGMRQ